MSFNYTHKQLLDTCQEMIMAWQIKEFEWNDWSLINSCLKNIRARFQQVPQPHVGPKTKDPKNPRPGVVGPLQGGNAEAYLWRMFCQECGWRSARSTFFPASLRWSYFVNNAMQFDHAFWKEVIWTIQKQNLLDNFYCTWKWCSCPHTVSKQSHKGVCQKHPKGEGLQVWTLRFFLGGEGVYTIMSHKTWENLRNGGAEVFLKTFYPFLIIFWGVYTYWLKNGGM